MKEHCQTCPFWYQPNGVCFYPGNCDLPEDNDLLKLITPDDDSAEEAQKEIRTL